MVKSNCLICGSPTSDTKLCRKCNDKVRGCSAVVSQNIKKLRKLLDIKHKDFEWLEKFCIYATNIKGNLWYVLDYKKNDNQSKLDFAKCTI